MSTSFRSDNATTHANATPVSAIGLYAERVTFQPNTDQLLQHNADYATGSHDSSLAVQPARNLAVVACMDARLDPLAILGIGNGDAHMIRNGGGVVTDDVIRSLCLSQRALGTREIILIHHTDCGLHGLNEADFREELNAELGVKPSWSLESFPDPYDDVHQSMQRLKTSPFIQHKGDIRGFVFDVESGVLNEVAADHKSGDGPAAGRGAGAGGH